MSNDFELIKRDPVGIAVVLVVIAVLCGGLYLIHRREVADEVFAANCTRRGGIVLTAYSKHRMCVKATEIDDGNP